MTRTLEVGDEVGRTRINSLRWTKQRGWRATDAAGTRYYQYGPGSQPDGLYTPTETGVTLSVWPPAPEGQQRKPLRQVSPTKRTAAGRARPDEPLATWCQTQIEGVCTGRAEHRHHILTRARGGTDEATDTIDCCRADHDWIHAHPIEATERGFLRRAPHVGEAS